MTFQVIYIIPHLQFKSLSQHYFPFFVQANPNGSNGSEIRDAAVSFFVLSFSTKTNGAAIWSTYLRLVTHLLHPFAIETLKLSARHSQLDRLRSLVQEILFGNYRVLHSKYVLFVLIGRVPQLVSQLDCKFLSRLGCKAQWIYPQPP